MKQKQNSYNNQSYEKENQIPPNKSTLQSKNSNHNQQNDTQKYFISSQGKSKRDLNSSYDMPRTHSTQTLKSQNKSNNPSSYAQTTTNQPYRTENCSYINTTDNNDNFYIEAPPKNVDRTFQYIKSQFNIQNEISMQEQEWSSIYDIIPSKQPNTSFKNSEYSFSKMYHRNHDDSNKSRDSRYKSSQNKRNNHNIDMINYQSMHQSNMINNSNYYDDQQMQLNNSFNPQFSDQNYQSMNYSMNLPQSTKNVNMTDIMYSTTNRRGTQEFRSTAGIKPQHHLQQVFKMNRDGSQQRFIQHPDMSMLSNTFELEDDYRMQLIYLRLWQKAVKKIKQRRVEKKVFIKNLAIAIHFHEQSLMTKGVLSFIKFRVLREQRSISALKVSKKVGVNIKKFYFTQLTKKFKESRWIKSGLTIAQIYFKKETKKKLFYTFRQITNQKRDERVKILKRIRQRPGALKIIFEYLAMSLTGKSKIDLLKFHSIALNQDKIRYQQRQQFTQMIEQTLTYSMKLTFQNWMKFTDSILAFKNKMIKRKKKIAFNCIKQNLISIKKAKCQVYKVFMNIKYKSLYALRLNADAQQLLKKKQLYLFRRYRKRVFNRHFGSWQKLFYHYKNIMGESTEKNILSSSNFLKKYFFALKNFASERLAEKNQKIKSMMHYYDRYIRNCFSSWKQISKKRSLLNKARRVVQGNHELDEKEKYFKEWIRRCFYNEMIKRLRAKTLKTKFIQSLKLAIRYKKVRQEIVVICQEQYLRNLQLKALKSLRVKLDEKLKLRNMLQIFQRKTNLQKIEKILNVFKLNVEENIHLREQEHIVERFRQQQLFFKYFEKIRKGTQKQRLLKQNFIKISSYVKSKVKFRTLQKFAQKLDCKQQLKYYQFQFLYKKQMNEKSKIFYYMLNKKRDLNHKYYQVNEIIRFKNKATIFRLWYQAACQIQYIRNGYLQLQNHQVTNTLQKYWKNWSNYVEQSILRKKYEQVAIFFFLRNFLKKYLYSLRNHALIKIQKRKILTNLAMHRFRHQFQAFKKILFKDINRKKIYFRQISTILKKVISNWNSYSSKRRYLRQNKIQFKYKYEQVKKLEILQVLLQNKEQKGLCYQEQYLYMKQRKQQLIIQNLFDQTQQSKFIQKKYESVHKTLLYKMYQERFYLWYNQFILSKKERTLALPFLAESKIHIKRKQFDVLKQYSLKSKFFKKCQLKIDQRYSLKLKLVYFQVLQQYSKSQAKINNIKIQIQNIHQYHQKKQLLMYIQDNVKNRKNLKNKQMTLVKQTRINTQQQFFNKWIERYNKWMNFKPKLQQAEQLYHYMIAKKAFNKVKQYLYLGKKKIEMLKSIEYYRLELLQHKAFSKLKEFHKLQGKVQRFQYRSQVQFKGTCFQQWRKKYLELIKRRRSELNQQRVIYCLQNHKEILKRAAFNGFSTLLVQRQIKKQGISQIENVFWKIMKRKSFKAIKEHMIEEIKNEEALVHQQVFKKKSIMKALRFFMDHSKLNQTMQMQSNAFNRIKYLRKVLNALKNNKEKTNQMRLMYAKTNKAYRKQLLQKALWTLHWNKMRNHYLRGLFFKSGEYNDHRIKQKLFKSLKIPLITKYKALTIQEKREFRVLSDYLSYWRYQYDQIEAKRQLEMYNQNARYQEQNDLSMDFNNHNSSLIDPNFGINLSNNDHQIDNINCGRLIQDESDDEDK
ncbi:UNKNOWN [Stylonychia lemnae]|uniref:Uncharacterized protein n=1 Tax=Stylonychia lemnae TaxID=5949 RepID=A0A078AUC6_STYLE|nr:UNKNOWN [Stylonychia lemnae]|eukprot:CDW84837.1 UNKNOWN [Stylonychia lemnae]